MYVQTSATPDYTMGYGEEMLETQLRATAENSAKFLLPYLRPGLRVLDFGCGPGTISVGLARATAPGEMHGVDMESWDMFTDLLAADDGHPQMGKDMKGHILEAGFANIRMSASFSVYNSPVQIANIHRLISQWLLSPEVADAAIKYGASSERLVNDLQVAYDRWKEHPGALFTFAYGEAIANKPLS